jgi:hypothetical protein
MSSNKAGAVKRTKAFLMQLDEVAMRNMTFTPIKSFVAGG